MVMIQLGVGLPEAMARLRAYAYTNDRVLSDVADDIVAVTVLRAGDDRCVGSRRPPAGREGDSE